MLAAWALPATSPVSGASGRSGELGPADPAGLLPAGDTFPAADRQLPGTPAPQPATAIPAAAARTAAMHRRDAVRLLGSYQSPRSLSAISARARADSTMGGASSRFAAAVHAGWPAFGSPAE